MNKIIYLKRKLIENKYLSFLLLFYFVFRLINLTKLPIFNDEAIYLDWGWREIHKEGNLYYSLYDAKQPFLMWIFGISETLFSDPLFSGRIVSVFAGFLTAIGIYKLSRYLFDIKTALFSVFLYTVIPIFSFYDRQALMESSIAAVGVWSCYFLIKSFSKLSSKYSIFLGLVLGIGFFIKSSALIFLVSFILIFVFYLFFISNRAKLTENFLLVFGVFLSVIVLLLINPLFWSTFQTNSRYTLTVPEFLSFPVFQWVKNFLGNLEISFFYLTPFIFIAGLIGFGKIIWEKNLQKNIFVLFFTLGFFINTVLVRAPSDRYLVSFLPFFVVGSSYLIYSIIKRYKIYGYIFFLCSALIPFILTFFQIVNPPQYIKTMSKYTGFNNLTYLEGFTSGYGVSEVVNYFNEVSKSNPIFIGVGENTGNPESAMIVYFNKNTKAKVAYFDSRLFGTSLNGYDCLSYDTPLYFVSRDEQLVGLDKYLQKIKTIKNPYFQNTIGVYALKKNCKGKVFQLRTIST